MKPDQAKILKLFVFLLVITGLSIAYDYPATLMKRPQSVHNWRQCDGASLALSYYQNGMQFFKPQTHGLYSDGFKTGYTAPSEIPILYYFIAILYNIFGYHEFIFRLVNLLLFFLGLYYLFRLSYVVLNDLVYALVTVVLIFSSPLLVYYANNFLPNTVALSFSFIGWYYFYNFYQDKQNRSFLLSMLFFGIAGAMKVTELTGPIIVFALILADKTKLIHLQLNPARGFWLRFSALLLIFIVVGGWIFYAKSYNTLHGSTQFSTYTFPFWQMNGDDVATVFHKMRVLWFQDYFYPPTFYFMLACIVIMVFCIKKSDMILALSSAMFIAAIVFFSLLWFQALGDHDYFFIGFYVLPALVFINFFLILKKIDFRKVSLRIMKVVFVVVAVVNVYHARERHMARYNSWMNDYPEMKDLYTLKPKMSEIGILDSDTVIFYPSYNIRPLYLLNLKGWTIHNHKEVNAEIEQRDSVQMNTFLKRGADYFITNDILSAAAFRPFKPYLKDLIGTYNSVYVFRLPPRQVNFNPEDVLIPENP